MASPTTSRPPAKWERTGEPGSAFRGLTRPGRGGRGRGSYRGSRGGGRGTSSSQESKIITEEKGSSSKPDPLLRTPNPSTKLHAQLSHAKSTSEKPGNLPGPPKQPPRRVPEVIPSLTNNAVPGAQSISLPSAAKPSTRRRRSQTVKANANNSTSVPTSIKVNELPPYKAPIAPVPVLQIKDTPPHLKVHSDMRHNIDALVERVRAVAMENNRPTTPGSHIDWAGDDDDSLPDLDDWGVNTSTFASSASETISPIIVEGLKPLPDVVAPVSGTPLRQVINLDSDDVETDQVKPNASTTVDKEPISACNTPIASKVRKPVQKTKVEHNGQYSSASKLNISQPSAPQPSTKSIANKQPWHPSLPAKPISTSTAPPNLRPVAGPMRPTLDVRLPNANNKGDIPLQSTCPAEPSCTNPIGGSGLKDVPLIVEPIPIEEKRDANPRPSDSFPRLFGSDTSKSAAQSDLVGIKGDGEEVPSEDDTKEGLEASIHAPKAGSTSAPAELSSYSQTTTIPQKNSLTHRKAHTVGKTPSFARGANNEVRFAWSNDRGRGGFHSTTHVRNHSSPPATGSPTHHRIHASRPVLTGDAISRIARTIGHSNPTP